MVSVVGQASFLFHISQQFLPILEGISVEKSKLRGGRFHFTFKNRWEMWNGCNFRVITMRGRGFSFHGPVNLGEAGGHRSKLKVVLALQHSSLGKIFLIKHWRNKYCHKSMLEKLNLLSHLPLQCQATVGLLEGMKWEAVLLITKSQYHSLL